MKETIESEDGYYYDIPEEAEDLINIEDVGAEVAMQLFESGYRTLSDFAGKNPKKLSEETGVKTFTAIRIVSQAEEERFDPRVYKNSSGDNE